MKFIIINSLSFLFFINIYCQSQNNRILWNKIDNEPVQYATIKSVKNYTISNENGVFEFYETSDKIIIENIAYERLEIEYSLLKKSDTIFMKPNVYSLDEVIIEKDAQFNNMLRTILSDYALQPHQEKFFLRAIIKKNNEFYKIVDFSGYLEKKTLFDTRTKPMPKKNYSVRIDNIRKAGFENRDYDFELLSFNYLLNQMSSVYLSPRIYNLSYQISKNEDYSKIILTPKNEKNTFTKGYYILNNDNTFKEVEIIYQNKNSQYNNIKDVKFRTIFIYTKSNFEKNNKTNKLQLNKAIIKSKTEVYSKGIKDIFEVNYIFYANPVNNSMKLKNNINLKKDIFELKGKYDSKYWEKNEILTLTKEMQEFINKVNSSKNKSDFRTKTNMNKF